MDNETIEKDRTEAKVYDKIEQEIRWEYGSFIEAFIEKYNDKIGHLAAHKMILDMPEMLKKNDIPAGELEVHHAEMYLEQLMKEDWVIQRFISHLLWNEDKRKELIKRINEDVSFKVKIVTS